MPTPLPQITPVPRDLTADEVRGIVAMAERAHERRAELAREMRAALDANDAQRVTALARRMVGLEEQ